MIGGFVPEIKADINEKLTTLKTQKEVTKVTSKSKTLEDQINILDKALKD